MFYPVQGKIVCWDYVNESLGCTDIETFLKGIISYLGMAVLFKIEVLHTHAYVTFEVPVLQ
jgi:hypothetical protein